MDEQAELEGMKPVMCKSCGKLMFYCHVYVGYIKHKCGHRAYYQILTESFLQQVKQDTFN